MTQGWVKSSYSSGNGACVEWRKSSRCDSGSCIEVGLDTELVQVRDSKDPEGPVLTFNSGSWVEFVAGVKAEEFDLPRP